MPIESESPSTNTAGQLGFRLIIGLQILAVPFVVIALFFSVMGWEHFSSEDKFDTLLLGAYPVWLISVGFLGKALLNRQQWLAAYALALSPLLLLIFWLPISEV